MKKKKISLKLVTLVMSGTLLAAPMVSSAEEAGNNSTTISTNTSESTEGTGSTATASENTAGTGSTMSTSAALAGTGSAVESAASAGTSSPTTGTNSTTASATTGTGSPVGTVPETPVDSSTTLPNNVDTVIPDDETKGTEINSSIWGRHIEYDPDLGIEAAPIGVNETEIKVNISPEESKGEETLSPTFGSAFFYPDTADNHPSRDVADTLRTRKNKDFVIKGDLSIAKEDSTEGMDSTDTAPHTVKPEESYILKAEYDVSAVANSRETFGKFFPYGVENVSNESPLVKTAKAELGFRSTFSLGADLNGSFYVPESSEDAKAHYTLKSADGNTLLYRINYAKSSFSKDKVSLQMDFDVQDGVEHSTGTLQSFTNLLKNSAKKIQIIAKGLRLDNASGRRTVTDTAEGTRRSVEGTIQNTLVGYMNSTSSYLYRDHSEEDINSNSNTISWKEDSYDLHNAFQWGAIQSDSGRDFVSGKENDKILLTVQFTDLVKKNQPINPGQNGNPGGNNGNSGNGGSSGNNGGNGITDRTPVNPNPSDTSLIPGNSIPQSSGDVLGADRPMTSEDSTSLSATEGNLSKKKNGTVLGANRDANGKNTRGRSAVSTGDETFSGLWASLFGISLLSLAGYAMLRKKES